MTWASLTIDVLVPNPDDETAILYGHILGIDIDVLGSENLLAEIWSDLAHQLLELHRDGRIFLRRLGLHLHRFQVISD